MTVAQQHRRRQVISSLLAKKNSAFEVREGAQRLSAGNLISTPDSLHD
jgi:hypothetical protein